MKIERYKKKKNNIYDIIFSNNEKIELYDDIIIKYELLLKKEISKEELINIKKDNNLLKSYYDSIKYISTRLRTEKEIRNKLKDYDKNVINNTINRLKKEGYLNNELYIKSYINDEVNLNNIGQNKILYDLKKKGFNEEDILDYLNKFDNNIWLDKIDKYINKKINSNHNLSGLFLKNKIINELVTKGFLKEDILLVIEEYSFIDNDLIYDKEYNKLKSKLSKKYDGEELEYRIKMNLYKKGFKKMTF